MKKKQQVDEAIKFIRPNNITKTKRLLNAAGMQTDDNQECLQNECREMTLGE